MTKFWVSRRHRCRVGGVSQLFVAAFIGTPSAGIAEHHHRSALQPASAMPRSSAGVGQHRASDGEAATELPLGDRVRDGTVGAKQTPQARPRRRSPPTAFGR